MVMAGKAHDNIAADLREAIAVERGESQPDRLRLPAEIDMKMIRRKTGLSQERFASFYGVTMEQVRAWEQGRNRPLGGVRAYLMMIDSDHEAVARILEAARKRKAA